MGQGSETTVSRSGFGGGVRARFEGRWTLIRGGELSWRRGWLS